MSNPQIRVNAMSFAKLVKLMDERPRSKPQLAELTGLHVWTVRHYVDALHKERMAHIVRWEKDGMGRDVTAIYSLGFGADRPRAAKTGAQKARERRQRAKEAALQVKLTG